MLALMAFSEGGIIMESDRILRRTEVEAKIGLSRSTIYQAMADGEFPKPIRIGKRAVGWPLSVIEGWLASRVAASRHAA